MNQPTNQPANQPTLFNVVASAMGFRLLTDTAVQFVFPYLPLLAAGLGVSIIEIGWLLSVRAIVGLSSPLFGWLAENRGYRTVMRIGMLLSGFGLIIFATSIGLPMAALGMALMGLGSTAFVPTLFAWASALLPFNQRSKGLGAIELSWALAGMLGVPLIGFGIASFGWRPPLIVLGGLLLAASFIIGRLPGRSDAQHAQAESDSKKAGPQQAVPFFDLGANRVSAWAVIIGAGLISFANIHTFSVYAQWLVDLYPLDEVGLAWVAFTMGTAELVSNLGISFFGDKIGPLRGTKIAVIGAAIFFALLYVAQGLGFFIFLGSFFIARYFMENAFVNNIILVSEQTPEHRAKSLTFMSMASTIGFTVAAWSGPRAYTGLGPIGLIVPSVIVFGVIWLSMQQFAQEKGDLAA
jgi:predicted MFS family arabinose efflux permease